LPKSEKNFFTKGAKLGRVTIEQRRHIQRLESRYGIVPEVKGCYQYAQKMAIADSSGRVRYCEGFAVHYTPFGHAWNTIDGVIFDGVLRLTATDKRIYDLYYGFELPADEVRRIMSSTGLGGSVLEALVREKHSNIDLLDASRFVPEWRDLMLLQGLTKGGGVYCSYAEFLAAVEQERRGGDVVQPPTLESEV
jgi:hypothetical protein